MDLSQDYLLVDDPITVTVERKPEEGFPPVLIGSVDYVQRSGITRADLEKNPHWMLKDTAVFHLWAVRCPSGFLPRMSDKIVHGSANWLVESIEFMDLDSNGVQRYRLVCVRSQT